MLLFHSFRLLRILGRHDNHNPKKDDSYKRGEPDGSEEVTALQKTKKQKSRSKNDILDHDTNGTSADESDIDIYPVNHNETNRISGSGNFRFTDTICITLYISN